MKILIIDDSRSVHAYVTEFFSQKQVDLQHAYNGIEGLQKVSTTVEPYDLILLDWEMPLLNGPETLKELKARGVSIPVIMLTSKSSQDDIQQMMQAGAAEYIMKPFTFDILQQRIESICGTGEL